ncbi:MAG: 30S ribosomal protein S5 [Candidatus Omnitrophota bacterium]
MSGTNFTKQTEVQTEPREKVFVEKVIFINRVTKVTKGGKNLGFSALVVVGDTDGSVGFALGKANEVAEAIKKGIKKAKKSLVVINKKDTTIPHEVYGEFGAVRILLKPASKGTGVIASSTIRAICDCSGIKDILTKILKKSTNPINVVKATFMGLNQLKKA